ncbi:ParB/RepB/Spo0J family partition protein [Streptomyces violascens]|uniref:ParB/RepB/Spo0J family partition protein n=1 Tax=Streptomyces violascens TaxID=67381 RepID=UPI0036A17D04
MSKSDLLGNGAAFSNARRTHRSERGRAKAIAQGDLPDYELIRLPLDRVATTPLNPRQNFGTDEEMTRFGEELREAQLSACVAVSRQAYLNLWPDHEVQLGNADYVLINGERRYRSAQHVGLDILDFVVRDDLAASREDFIDHLLAENLDREDFDVIERANGVQQLVAICAEQREHGAKSRAAKRLGKSPAWVTQQLMLLELPVPIQSLLSSGDLPERDGRFLAGAAKESPALSSDDLLSLLKERKAQDAEKKAQQKEILAAHTSSAESSGTTDRPFTAVKTPSAPPQVDPAQASASEAGPETPAHDPVTPPPTAQPVSEPAGPRPEPESEPRNEVPEPRRQKSPVPAVSPGDQYLLGNLSADAEEIAQSLIERLDNQVLLQVTVLLQRHNRSTLQAPTAAQGS